MSQTMFGQYIQKLMPLVAEEDDFTRNLYYAYKLPQNTVNCSLKFKDDMLISGLPFFFEVFNYFQDKKFDYNSYLEWEGQSVTKEQKAEIEFQIPFHLALTAERVALNLLQMSCSISTHARRFSEAVEGTGVKVLDTRKTTPLYRSLEKYAVRVGGGYNHRFGQADVFMVKDNHKACFGGVRGALDFFESVGAFYQDVVVEIHDLEELKEAQRLGVKHLMLDNFTPEQVREAVKFKQVGVTYEVSGGINLNNIKKYCVQGVDAISVGSMTYGAPKVDISLKYKYE